MDQKQSLEDRLKLYLTYDRCAMRWVWPMLGSFILGASVLMNALMLHFVGPPYALFPKLAHLKQEPTLFGPAYWIQLSIGGALLALTVVAFFRSGHWIRMRNATDIRPCPGDDPETVASMKGLGFDFVPIRARNVVFLDGWLWRRNRRRHK